MLRKFIILLALLMPAQLFAQVDYTFTQYTGTSQAPPLANINQTGGTPMNLGDDEVRSTQIGFNFEFYGESFSSAFISSNGLISFQYPVNGCCGGYNFNDPGNEYSIFAVQTDLINIQTLNPYTKLIGEEGSRQYIIAWYDMPVFYDSAFRSTFEITLFEGSNNVLINYGDVNNGGRFFTAGIKGSNIDGYELIYTGSDGNSLDYTSYLFTPGSLPPPPPPPPPTFLYWDRLASEYQSFTLTSPGVVRYGADGVYVYQSLEAGTYGCGNSLFGDPIGGVVKSCELGSNEPPVAEVNCANNPLDPSCIIDSIIDDDAVNDPMFAEETTPFLDEEEQEQDTIIEEMFAADQPAEEIFSEESDTLEEILTDESEDETIDDIEETFVVKELNDEEKSNALVDSISKDVLESALAIAADVISSTSVVGGEGASQSSDSSKKEITLTISSVSEVTQDSSTTSLLVADSTDIVNQEGSSSEAALDILETGRQLGQESLLATMSMTEMAAAESVSQAENVAAESSSDSLVASAATVIETSVLAVSETQEQQSMEVESLNAESTTQEQVDQNNETFVVDAFIEQMQESGSVEQEQVADTSIPQLQDTVIEVQNEEVVIAEVTSVESVSDAQDTSMVADASQQEQQQSAIEYTTVEQIMEMFAENINNQVQSEQEELENNIVQQAIVSSQQSEDDNKMGFAEAEAVTIVNDPALANAFNVQPNTANLELLGVLSSAGQDKSDAELRAEQVVAANKEEQDAINANYMEADQSSILAAIGSETDVSAYRTAMLRDNNTWYKPEDIYKGAIIKDNVRGSYFLEKGNTDTYKKMVEEQYKDE